MNGSATLTLHEELYGARLGRPELVLVPPARFLAIHAAGIPGDQSFRETVGALYAIAYTARFALKKSGGPIVIGATLWGGSTTRRVGEASSTPPHG